MSGFNAKNGARDWFYQAVLPSLTLRGTSWPLLEEGFIFTGFANGKVAMIYPDSGAVRLELLITLNEGKSELERIVDDVIEENPEQVVKVKSNPKLIGWFVGQVMKETKGQANPSVVNKVIIDKLKT